MSLPQIISNPLLMFFLIFGGKNVREIEANKSNFKPLWVSKLLQNISTFTISIGRDTLAFIQQSSYEASTLKETVGGNMFLKKSFLKEKEQSFQHHQP